MAKAANKSAAPRKSSAKNKNTPAPGAGVAEVTAPAPAPFAAPFTGNTEVAQTGTVINAELLRQINDATIAGGYMYADPFELANMERLALVEVNHEPAHMQPGTGYLPVRSVVDAANAYLAGPAPQAAEAFVPAPAPFAQPQGSMAFPDPLATQAAAPAPAPEWAAPAPVVQAPAFAPVAPAPAPAFAAQAPATAGGFAIDVDVPVPLARPPRASSGLSAAIDALPPGGSLHLPVSDAVPTPAEVARKNGSSVSAAKRRYAVQTGVDSEGQPIVEYPREFIIRPVGADDKRGPGARVFRTK